MRDLGLTELDSVFKDPRISIWRSIRERENGTLDAALPDGRHVRLHVKRYRPAGLYLTPAEVEVHGIFRLQHANIPTVDLVAWGVLPDRRSLVLTEDLAGFKAADHLLAGGASFDELLAPTADLAAKLHDARLHHRDLYLCHFFAKRGEAGFELRLIDAGRVRRLPPWPLRQRWIVKDLAQFWYSSTLLPVSDEQRLKWLDRYGQQRKLSSPRALLGAIGRKAQWIARHDRKLQQTQPDRYGTPPGRA